MSASPLNISLTSRRSWLSVLVATSALVAGGLAGTLIPQAAAAGQSYSFQLNGDVAGGTPPTSFDWTNFLQPCGGTGPTCQTGTVSGDVAPTALTAVEQTAGYVASAGSPDYVLGDKTTFTGGTKDTLPISGWGCATSNSVTAKDDLLNAYAVAYKDPSTHHTLVFFGAEKRSNNGDNNIAVWLLQGAVKCNGSNFGTAAHANGDILLAAAFTNGGTQANITVFEWEGVTNSSVGGLVLVNTDTQECTPANTLPPTAAATLAACAITDTAAGGVHVPWNSQLTSAPSTASGGSTLDTQEFYEGGLDLTTLTGNDLNPGLTPCINTLITDSRTSQSPTATLKDYVGEGLHTCGTLHVNKYIDSNANAALDSAHVPAALVTDDQTSGAVVSGFHFTVKDASNATVCAGTTDSTGALSCTTGSLSNLDPGTFTVTEDGVPAVSATQPYYWYNTDPGNATTSKSVDVSSTGATTNFGNACFVTANFTVNKSASANGFFIWYKVGPSGMRHDITSLSQSGNLFTATVSDTFTQGNTFPAGGTDKQVYWGFGINENNVGGTEQTSAATNSPLDLAGDGYRSDGNGCVVNDTTNFAPVTITGVKYKDINGNGTRDSGEGLLTTFGTFQLLQSGSQVGNDVQTDATGTFTFNSVNPGAYTIHEVNPTGWVQTQPASGDISVTVGLGSPATVTTDAGGHAIAFGDTPLSNITVTFNPGAKLGNGTTPATKATGISCVDGTAAKTPVGSNVNMNTLTTNNVQIKQSAVVCTITFTDP